MRQCTSRYAIHAGRNLPDKELRSDMLQLLQQPTRINRTQKKAVAQWAGRFRRPLHVAMQLGLYHHLEIRNRTEDAWRIVSEDPLSKKGFLLIVCTTGFSLPGVARGQASNYLTSTRWILRRFSIQPSAKFCVAAEQGRKFYLRTVIVTAAVYWGFGRGLHLAANPLP